MSLLDELRGWRTLGTGDTVGLAVAEEVARLADEQRTANLIAYRAQCLPGRYADTLADEIEVRLGVEAR